MAESLSSVAVKDFNNSQELMRTVEDSSSNIHVSGVEKIATPVGGASSYRILSAGSSDDATVVKAGAGKLYGYRIASIEQAAAIYLKIYDKATAPTTSDTPKFTIPVSVAAGATSWQSAQEYWEAGVDFSAGISYRLVEGLADSDGTDVDANEVLGHLIYE